MFTTVTGIIGAVHFLTASPYRPGIQPIEMELKLPSETQPTREEIDRRIAERHIKNVKDIAHYRYMIDFGVGVINKTPQNLDRETIEAFMELVRQWQNSLKEYDGYIKDHPGIEKEILIEIQKLKEMK